MEKRTHPPDQPAEQDGTAPTRFQHLSAHAQHALGAIGASLALLGAAEPAAAVQKNTVGAKPHEGQPHVPSRPKPSSLRGYNRPLKPEAQESLASSTVKIAWRYKGSEGYQGSSPWNQLCTGTKVTAGAGDAAATYISTAAHCFKNNVPANKHGVLEGSAGEAKAYNIAGFTKDFQEIAVFDARQPKASRQPLAIVNGISISNRSQDRVLMSVTPSETSANTADFRTFEQIGSLPLPLEQKHAVKRPTPGQKVALFGVPQANGDRQTAGLGRYIGRTSYAHENGTIEYVDVVGIKPKKINQDTCNFGASGSSFSATVGTQTYYSGPLSKRINDIWDPQYVDTTSDFTSSRGDYTNELEDSAKLRKFYEGRFNLDLSSFNTICIYAANLPRTSQELIEGLQNEPPVRQFPSDSEAVGFESGKGGGDSGSMK